MEWLKEILGEQLYNQVKSVLDEKKIKLANLSDGSFIPRDKFNEKNEESKLLKEQIEEFKKKSKEVDKLVSSNEELKSQIDSLNNSYNDKLAEKDKQLINYSKENALKNVLQENKFIYPDLILKSIDYDKIEIEDGKIKSGFDVNEFKSKYPSMAETVQTTGNVTNPGNTNPLTSSSNNLTKKQQLIKQHDECKDITQKYILRQEIQKLE
jgi:hypothetical protein